MFDINAAEAVLKQLYIGAPKSLVYKDNPTLAMLPKGEEFFGENIKVPLKYATANRSGNFSNAQSNISGPKYGAFLVTRKRSYALNQLDNETLLATSNDKGAFVKAVEAVADSVLESAALGLSANIFRSGSGSLATGTLSAGTVTLTNSQDIVNFEVGNVLVAASTDGGALVGSGATATIATINRSAGTFTISPSSPSGWTGTLYIGQQGEMSDNGNTANSCIEGFQSWIVGSSVTSATFYGLDRTKDTVRLAGQVLDVSAYGMEEALQILLKAVAREGGKPSHVLLSFDSYNALIMSLGSKVQFIDDETAEVGFRGVLVNGPNSTVKVFPDRSCPAKKAFVLQMDTWKLHAIGPAPRLLPYPDGNKYLRVATADASEIRAGMYGNLVCDAPGWNAIGTLAE